MAMDAKEVSELGVNIRDFIADKPRMKIKCYNSKLKIFREFALASLSVLAEIKSKQKFASSNGEALTHSQAYALDALACTGIAGIQWKKHLSNLVHVTMAEHVDTKMIVHNAHANLLSCTELKLNPLRVSGDFHDKQDDKEVHFCQAEAKAAMTMEAFNFIYLSSSKNCASYFEPALHSVTSDGIVCIVVPDISLFARSPHVVQRLYGADIVKTEYLKELAARIILASLARAAARCIKGISPQYILTHEDSLLICVKVSRGHSAADSSINEIEKLLHCRLCEERIFMPNQLAPLDDPYSLLSCSCKKNNPGKTAVVLGPVWKGPLFDLDFLNLMYGQGKQLSLSAKFFELVNLLIKESVCAKFNIVGTIGANVVPELKAEEKIQKVCSDLNAENGALSCVTTSSGVTEGKTELTNIDGDQNHKLITQEHIVEAHEIKLLAVDETKDATISRIYAKEDDEDQTELNSAARKRKVGDKQESECDNTVSKRQKQDKECDMMTTVNVPFYYNVTKFRRMNLPRLDKLVALLHGSGHRASRTHFDCCGIRTSASIEEFLNIFG